MPRTPDICPTFVPQAEKIKSLVAQYETVLEEFRREGTPEIAQELDRLKVEILALKEDINKTLEPLGYDLDNPLSPESPESIDALLKAVGSKAEVDRSIEGGVIAIEITPDLKEKLKNLDTALIAYEDADNHSLSLIWDRWRNMKTYEAPSQQHFDAIILSYSADEATRRSSDAIVADMDRAGLRPATIAELIALGITRPECNKQKGHYLVGLGTKEFLVSGLQVPRLSLSNSMRYLSWIGWIGVWRDFNRFVCVRK